MRIAECNSSFILIIHTFHSAATAPGFALGNVGELPSFFNLGRHCRRYLTLTPAVGLLGASPGDSLCAAEIIEITAGPAVWRRQWTK
jgi:hypothetical protein